MTKQKLTNILLYALPALAAVLTALPWCVMMRFAGDGEEFVAYFSGFSLVPLGYAFWSPMLTGIAAILLTILGIIHAIKEKPRLLRWMLSIAVAAFMMSITPLAFGNMSVAGTLIALAIGAEAAMLYGIRENQ